MKEAPVLHRVEYAFYRLAKVGIRLLPHPTARRFGRSLGGLAYRALGGPRKVARRNVEQIFPELEKEKRERIVRECFAHFGGHFFDLVSFSRFAPGDVPALFDVDGGDILDRLEEEGRPYFLTAGHYGCWETALFPLRLRIDKLQAVARPIDNPFIDADLRRQRERFGTVVIDKAGAAHRMLNAVRKGARVAIVIDQHVRPSAGVQVPFLGHPAWTSPVLAMLALRLQAPVVPLSCVPAPGGRYRLSVGEPIEPEGKGHDAEVAMTARYLEPVEEDIRRRPELWLWMHRRWREA